MSVVRMPERFPARNDDYRPWTEYENLHEIYTLSYEDVVEALAATVKRQVIVEYRSGGKIISFTNARAMQRRAAMS